ncbi:hypothetical protein AB0399_27410, partial [Streptomyces sp. NPDC088194]
MVDRPQATVQASQYDPRPRYPVSDGTVMVGWADAADALGATVRLLAVDGPAAVEWEAVARELTAALAATRPRVTVADVRDAARDWADIRRLTESETLRDDPDFARLAGGSLSDLLDPDALA